MSEKLIIVGVLGFYAIMLGLLLGGLIFAVGAILKFLRRDSTS